MFRDRWRKLYTASNLRRNVTGSTFVGAGVVQLWASCSNPCVSRSPSDVICMSNRLEVYKHTVRNSGPRPRSCALAGVWLKCGWLQRWGTQAQKASPSYFLLVSNPIQRTNEDADCPPYIQLFRSQDFCSCCHKSFKQFAVRLTVRKADLLYSQFRRSLKTFLFGQPDHGALWTLLTAPCRNTLTHSLTYLNEHVLDKSVGGKTTHTEWRILLLRS